MTKVYRAMGLSCMYPENWELSEDLEDNQPIGFTLQSPNTAFMTVLVYPWTVSPKDAIDEVKKALDAEYDEVELEPLTPWIDLGKGALDDTRAGELRFYYLDLLVAAKLLSFSWERRTFLVQFQAEDREYEHLGRVFEAMVASMVQSIRNGSDAMAKDEIPMEQSQPPG